MKGYTRSASNKMIAGVCGGLGELMNVDPVLVRLAFVFLATLTAAVPMVVAYVVAWIIVPVDDSGSSSQPASGSGGGPAE